VDQEEEDHLPPPTAPQTTDPFDLAPASVAELYRAAADVCAATPGHALVQLRAALVHLLDDWLRRAGRSQAGAAALKADRLISHDPTLATLKPCMDKVRLLGNLGAHPEQHPGSPPTFADARDALEAMHDLVAEWCRRFANPTGPLATFAAPVAVDLAGLTVRAILGRDRAATLAVADHLRARGDAELEAARRKSRDERTGIFTIEETAHDHRAAQLLYRLNNYEEAGAAYGEAMLAFASPGVDRDLPHARSLMGLAARMGHSGAQAELATAHLIANHDLVPVEEMDTEWGFELAHASADQDDPAALNLLVKIYGEGIGVPRDLARAEECARRASHAGYPLAQLNLARMLLRGSATPADDEEVDRLISQATEAGVREAGLLEFHRALQVHKGIAPDSAWEALRAAAQEGVHEAQAELGMRLFRGDGIDRDLLQGGLWLCAAMSSASTDRERDEIRKVLPMVRDQLFQSISPPSQRPPGVPETPIEAGDDAAHVACLAAAHLISDAQDNTTVARTEVELMMALGRFIAPSLPAGAFGPKKTWDPPTHEDRALLKRAFPNQPQFWNGSAAERSRAKRAPSLNQACLCGSGRKFKGCCGRES
jgi:TPR repeat protein